MKKIPLLLCSLCCSLSLCVDASAVYLKKFQTYSYWTQHLDIAPTDEFLTFIQQESPLTNKLRHKWLYALAEKKDWQTFCRYYQPSADVTLQCYAANALYQQNQKEKAIKAVIPLWLTGSSQSSACDEVFNALLKNHELDESLITKRIVLALEKRNLSLVRYLLKQYKTPRLADIALLDKIYRNPESINQLKTGELHDDYYLYGLKRMVSTHMDKAVKFWAHVRRNKLLSQAQQQAFLAHLALYKAIRNQPDAPGWFKKVQPDFYNDALIDWQIRFALKHHQWAIVESLLLTHQDEDNLAWQYWLARALEAQGKIKQALPLYKKLASSRHYYGFLASQKLHQPLYFEEEKAEKNEDILKPYEPFLAEIKALYTTKQTLQASRILNDFVLELPKEELSALSYWLAHELHWYAKSVYFSNSYSELNDQLELRFPLAYIETVTHQEKNNNIAKPLIYAIIRQESTFRDDVISSVGAHGLMQLMPATAKNTAKIYHIDYNDKYQLFDAKTNIHLGSAYLQQLAKRFNRHPLLMAAAYNAGPTQVNYWLKNHSPKQLDIWIETLPWHETRNYLKNIIAFYAVYQYRLHQSPDISSFLKPI